MYLSATTQSLIAVTDATATTDEPQFTVSYQDFTSLGMTMPMLSNHGDMTGTSDVTLVAVPGASTTRQIMSCTVCNIDTVSHTVTIYKDVSGTTYQVVQALLQAGDTLVYTKEYVWMIVSSTGSPSSIIREYNANDTWVKPAGLKAVLVFAIGAGGGGGSGTRQAAGINRFGGGGGGGGTGVWRYLTASELTTSVAVTVGVGGIGGTGIAVDTTVGNAGSPGGASSFGASVLARGGLGGGAGNTTSPSGGNGGAVATCTPAFGPYVLLGAGGGNGQTTSGTTGITGLSGFSMAPGGSGGGGINSGNTSSVATYVGGSIYNNGIIITGGATGVAGADNQALSLFFHPSLTGSLGLGTGGGGGLPSAVDGGDGGDYGAGGGGGSGVLNGTVSGAGGDGGGGLILVLEIY